MVDTQGKAETPCTKGLLRLIVKGQKPGTEQKSCMRVIIIIIFNIEKKYTT